MNNPLLSGFEPVAQHSLFIVVKFVQEGNKLNKKPINFRTGRLTNHLDPKNRCDLQTAIDATQRLGIKNHGVGFVFTGDEPYFFLDIDKCLSDDNKWSELSENLLKLFPLAYVEISKSGKGLHVIGTGACSEHACRNEKLGLELYTSGRFVALTGLNARGSMAAPCQKELHALVEKYFTRGTPSSENIPLSAQVNWNGPADDETLIRRALNSHSKDAASIFGGVQKATFRDLWECNESKLIEAYPPSPNSNTFWNASSAEAALAQHLAFWTGNDYERIERLMRQSALVREKWEREDYLERTINFAISKQTTFLNDKKLKETVVFDSNSRNGGVVSSNITYRNDATFLTAENQIQLFKGCTYVTHDNKILTPGGDLLDQERFNVTYGGYSFPLNDESKLAKHAWQAFTQSQLISTPRADVAGFYPLRESGKIFAVEGKTIVNSYYPIPVLKIKGDATPFINHIKLLFPLGMDCVKLLNYLASLIQNPGVKFYWCPVIQGVQGNGKTLLSLIIVNSLGRKHCHFAKANQVHSPFNSWQYGKLFIAIDDIDLSDNPRTIEILKTMLTGILQEIEAKGQDKITKEICANFLINTNHKDGLPKFENERRFAHFFAAQQEAAHLIRDGMDVNYFKRLHHWLNNEHGYAICTDFLSNYDLIDAYNPATSCLRAPDTSSTQEAVTYGRGGAADEIIEAVAQGRIGFKNGWISTIMLDRLLQELKIAEKFARNRRTKVLEDLGYVLHPALSDGRVNNLVLPDNGKPRLYILRTNRELLKLSSASDVEKTYQKDQTFTP